MDKMKALNFFFRSNFIKIINIKYAETLISGGDNFLFFQKTILVFTNLAFYQKYTVRTELLL